MLGKPSRRWTSSGGTYISGLRRVSHVEECIRTRYCACTRSQKNSSTSFVDRIVGYGVVVSAPAAVIRVDARLGAAVDGVRFRGVGVAAQIDGVEELGATNFVGGDCGAVPRTIGGVSIRADTKLGAADAIFRDCDPG